MFKRVLVGAILIALLAALVVLDWLMEQSAIPRVSTGAGGNEVVLRGLPLAVGLALLLAVGFFELVRMGGAAGLPMFRYSGMVGALFVGTLPFWRQAMAIGPHGEALTQLSLAAVVIVLFVDQLIYFRTQDVMRRIGASLLGVCYLGVCGAIVLGIRMEYGLRALVLFLVAVKGTDVGAYFVGSAIGRHKLVPWLSPSKTWEGLLGGLAFGVGCSVGFVALFAPVFSADTTDDITLLEAAVFGLVLGAFGQGADLCESAIKRDAGLKDAGRTVPGFGGVLDVIDSCLLSSPVAYVLLGMFR